MANNTIVPLLYVITNKTTVNRKQFTNNDNSLNATASKQRKKKALIQNAIIPTLPLNCLFLLFFTFSDRVPNPFTMITSVSTLIVRTIILNMTSFTTRITTIF